MEIRTQDPKRLVECLDRLMAATDSDEVMKTAANYADMLEALPTSQVYIEKAQLLLEKHNVKCP